MASPVVVVGASLAGLRAAEAIRGAGHDGELVVVGDEPHLPYTRPPLSKELLAGAKEADACAFAADGLEATWRLGTRAAGLDLGRRRVLLADGEELAFSRAVLATGARPRPWPGAPEGVFLLRSVDDALALRAAFEAGPRVAIVGAGFIGCEVAATARARGLDVTLIELAPHPMPSLGPELGARCAALHREHGVELRLGVGVAAVRADGVELADGSSVAADVVLVALGALPNTDWLRDSGLALQPGVVCDATLQAAEGVFCAGDIAAWPHPLADGEVVRIEHWTVAAEQGRAAGRNAVLEPEPFTAVPYFWTDQYDVKVQSVGFPGRADRLHVVERSAEGDRFVAVGARAARPSPLPDHPTGRDPMPPTPAPLRVDERRVRVLVGDAAVWGRRDGEEIELDSGERIAEAEATYLAPVEPSKIIAVHLTYQSRLDEYAATAPPAPSYFMKPPSALNGHRGRLRRPAGAQFLNYEGELAVVIGRRMHGVPEAEVLDHVAGYTCANDVGLHDFRHADRGSMLRVKGQDGFLPMGPELVPAAEFDARSFSLRTFVNGEVVQEGTAEDMLFPVAYQLADLCRLITLEPGDVVLTGTPANSRPMEPGDVVEVEIPGLGRLSNTVEAWEVDLSGPGDQLQVSPNTLHVALAIPEDEAERRVAEGRT